jgi:hypothetical protein
MKADLTEYKLNLHPLNSRCLYYLLWLRSWVQNSYTTLYDISNDYVLANFIVMVPELLNQTMHPNAIHAIVNATNATKLSPANFLEAVLEANSQQ